MLFACLQYCIPKENFEIVYLVICFIFALQIMYYKDVIYGEITQQLRALTVCPEDLNSVPSTHIWWLINTCRAPEDQMLPSDIQYLRTYGIYSHSRTNKYCIFKLYVI